MRRREALAAIGATSTGVLGWELVSQWTDYHDLSPPTVGGSTDQWAPPLLEMFDDLLSETPKIGSYADRPNDPPTGALYRAVDRDGVVYRYNGSSWEELGKSAGDPIDVFLVAGQSNAVGKGDSATSVVPDPTMAKQVANGALSPMDDPFGAGSHQADTGSAWPSFASSYLAHTGNKIAMTTAAVGSTAQVDAASDADGSWDTGGTLREDAVDIAETALDVLSGAGYEPTLRGILWSQGEADAQAIDNGTITQADYESAFTTMVSYYRNQLRSDLPIGLFQTGQPSSGDTAGFQAIRAAQAGFPNSIDHCQMLSAAQKSFVANGLMNPDSQLGELHYSQEGYNLMGRVGAANLAQTAPLYTSSDGTVWELSIANDGTISATEA